MVSLTDEAQEKIEELLAGQNNKEFYIRLSVLGGGCSGFKYDLKFDKLQEDDEVFGKVIVDSISYGYVNSLTMDFAETLSGSNFVFSNPNAKRTCGCGSSFAA